MAAERAEAATQQKDGFPSENGVKGSGARVISLEECNQHTREDSCWLIVHGKVLDVTEFLDEHPGGLDILLQSTGRDSTQDFIDINHSKTATKLLDKFAIGDYAGGAPPSKKADSAVTAQQLPSRSDNLFLQILKVLGPVLVIVAGIYLSQVFQK